LFKRSCSKTFSTIKSASSTVIGSQKLKPPVLGGGDFIRKGYFFVTVVFFTLFFANYANLPVTHIAFGYYDILLTLALTFL
jgi:hypothetical protein